MAMFDNTLFGLTGSPDATQDENQINELMRRLQMAQAVSTEGRESTIPFSGMAVQRPTQKADNELMAAARNVVGQVPAAAQNPQTIAPSIDGPAVLGTTAQTSSAAPQTGPSRGAGRFPIPAPPRAATTPVQAAAPSDDADIEPGFWDRLGAASQAYNTGGLVGTLAEGMSGRAARTNKATYDALIGMGVTKEMARAAVMNPRILDAVLASGSKSKPDWAVIGEDRFGKKQYGFVNPVTRQVVPYGDDAPVDDGMGDQSKTGEEYLKTLPQQEATQVKALTEGRLRPPPMGRKNPYWEQLLAKAGQYEPGFDMTKYAARQAVRTDFDKGKAAGNIKALNTVMGHLDSMDKAIEPLGNFSMAPGIMNPLKDAYYNNLGDEDYQRARANFRLAKGAVASELMKVFRETGGSVTEVKDWEEKIHEDDSPAALKQTVKSAIELIGSRLNAVNDQWNRTMNVERPMTALLSPSARKVWERLHPEEFGAAPASGGESVAEKTAPALATPEELRGVPKAPPPNARRGKDGKLYIPNPNQPGTYLPWIEETP